MEINWNTNDRLKSVSFIANIPNIIDNHKQGFYGLKKLNIYIKGLPSQVYRDNDKLPYIFTDKGKNCNIDLVIQIFKNEDNESIRSSIESSLTVILSKAAKIFQNEYRNNLKQAFILVGHSNWGKSQTLIKLTNDKHQIRNHEINNKRIFIRRMSNDDNEKGLLNFVKTKLDSKNKIILTFCPSFAKKDSKAEEILNALNQDFILFFFVLKNKYGKHKGKTITNNEIQQLNNFGKSEVLAGIKESVERAKKFEDFIKNNLW
jgi:hypothetical protein